MIKQNLISNGLVVLDKIILKHFPIGSYCCLWEGSSLNYVICVCLHIVVSNSYCVVFLFCFSLSCVPYVASLS